MDRRSFFRVAILGAAAGTAIEACPYWLEDLLKPRKTYFLPSTSKIPMIHLSEIHLWDENDTRYIRPLSLDGIGAFSISSLDYTVPYMGISRGDVSPTAQARLAANLKNLLG